MGRVKTEVELDEKLVERIDKRANATGRPRHEVIQEALRDQFQGRSLTEILNDLPGFDDLTDEESLELAYEELDAMRAERHEKSR